ncbi:MAG: tetratricopeptide repeat protein [Acidobacteria bacterium]|nr:tetratricopeptide repeat protein [Acidobacteriota bacterium]
MTNRFSLLLLAGALTMAIVTPADAANKEQQQMLADLRILQEQSQQLQNLIGSLAEAIKGVNARLDQQVEASRKTAADQKLVIDNLSGDVRVIREKLDDSNVRIGSLTQEVDALRQSLQQAASARPDPDPADGSGTLPGGVPLPTGAPVAVGTSPNKLYEAAYAEYTAGQWDLAILGFNSYILTFPKSDKADDAQVNIGNAYLNDGKPSEAVGAYDKAIRTYPGGDALPEAYFKKGLALQNLKDLDGAREAWDYAVKTFPDTDGGRLSKQRLDQLRKP